MPEARQTDARSVLVTGGAGFIGSYVVRALLDRGETPVVLDAVDFSPPGRFIVGDGVDDVEVVRGSVADWSTVVAAVDRWRPKSIIHLANITQPQYLQENPLPGFHVNVGGTLNVLEAARLLGAEQLIYLSSIGVLPACQYEPIDAAHPIFLAKSGVTSGMYGAAKIASEAFLFAYHNAFGLDFRSVRASGVYGFGMQWPIYIKPIVEGAVRGERVALASGATFPRDYTHAADVASLTVQLLDAPPDADRIVYGATGEELVTAGEVAQIVRELVPDASIEIGDDESAEDRLARNYRGRLSIDGARAIGWKPQFGIREGIADYIERYRTFLSR